MADKTEFLASIGTGKTAIAIDGQDGGSLRLDIPDTELGNFAPVMTMRGKVLRVTVEIIKPE